MKIDASSMSSRHNGRVGGGIRGLQRITETHRHTKNRYTVCFCLGERSLFFIFFFDGLKKKMLLKEKQEEEEECHKQTKKGITAGVCTFSADQEE